MKPTEKNIEILTAMGFVPEDKGDLEGWWVLESRGWAFVLTTQKSIKALVKRLMKTEYERGIEKATPLKDWKL